MTHKDRNGDYIPRQEITLSTELNPFWEYRKRKTWFIYGHVNNFKLTFEFNTTLYIWCKGLKEECEK